MFAPGGRKADGPPDGSKDSLANVERTGEFVCNVVTWDLREAMNVTSAPAPAGVDEAAVAGLEMVPSRRSEEHTSELQSLMLISDAVFCFKKKNKKTTLHRQHTPIQT